MPKHGPDHRLLCRYCGQAFETRAARREHEHSARHTAERRHIPLTEADRQREALRAYATERSAPTGVEDSDA